MRYGDYNNKENRHSEYERREQLMQEEEESYLQDEAEQQLKKKDEAQGNENGGVETKSSTTPEQQNAKEIETNSNSFSETNASIDTRELTSDKDEKIEVGTKVNYLLKQTGAELWSADTKKSYKWTVLNADGSVRVTQINDNLSLELLAKIPGNYTIQVEILGNSKPTGLIYNKKQIVYFENKNTELGGLSVGNFDFYFDGTEVKITVRVKFAFEKSIPEADQLPFKTKFFNAINRYWVNSGVSFEPESGNCFVSNIPLTIECKEDDNDCHKLVDVEKEKRREKVISDMNLYIGTDESTIAHEFGHVLGLYDEYDGGILENTMFWHDNRFIKDNNAMMNLGSELRQRYFEHYLKAINENLDTGCKYKIKAPF